ncbi:MAG: beta-ketoacyl-ACP synthase II [Acidimicrobiaceae bacterium]|nr:beta-ketoacyl-ACP synthase II [Acidimicrobiaceae bacterium]MBO0746939.1 beta-ketoacyl-ACP synthase II [Acidimicrobiaceae bacterium]
MVQRETRRVVVTGAGAVTPLGTTLDQTWAGLVSGRSGVRPISLFDASDLPVRIAAEVPGFDPIARFGKRRARHLDRVVQLALTSTAEALEHAKLDVAADPERIGVIYGTGIGGIQAIEDGLLTMAYRGPEWINPYALPMTLANMAAGHLAMEWGAKGYNSCTVTACTASAQSIGEGFDLIRLGRAEAMICGGSEAPITKIAVAGFAAMKALSTRNDAPAAASRPFDLDRDGFVFGEGAATLILEEREYALRRGAPILAEIVGFGATSDAHHITTPHPDGDGAVRSMRLALEEADLDPSQVDYINAHGTSTPPNDRVETLAVHQVFDAAGGAPPMSSTKSMTGHTLGAAGALESLVCLQVLATGIAPPTINLETPDPSCDLDYIPGDARPLDADVVMTNSFGFGGHNSTLIFRRP